MSEIPKQTSDDPHEMDHGELARPDRRHLPVPPRKAMTKGAIVTMAITGAAIAAALFALSR